jgi:uncharacterized membrane protein YqjE
MLQCVSFYLVLMEHSKHVHNVNYMLATTTAVCISNLLCFSTCIVIAFAESCKSEASLSVIEDGYFILILAVLNCIWCPRCSRATWLFAVRGTNAACVDEV